MKYNEVSQQLGGLAREKKNKKTAYSRISVNVYWPGKMNSCLLRSNVVISWTEQLSRGVASDLQKQWRTHKQPKQHVLLFQRRAKEVRLFEPPPHPPVRSCLFALQ